MVNHWNFNGTARNDQNPGGPKENLGSLFPRSTGDPSVPQWMEDAMQLFYAKRQSPAGGFHDFRGWKRMETATNHIMWQIRNVVYLVHDQNPGTTAPTQWGSLGMNE